MKMIEETILTGKGQIQTMSSSETQVEKVSVPAATDPTAASEHWPAGDTSLKRRLTERFSVPGALVLCHRRTIIGTWKACDTPFHVYNLGMGGVNFWSLGVTLKPGTKIKLTLVMPKTQPIDVIGVVVWSKEMPASGGADGAQQYTQITGVKFVDYDATAWAVLREVHQIACAGS